MTEAVDRKARIREYKETPRPMGVFRVRNVPEGRSFVGASVDLPAILNRHLAQMRLGAHPVRELQLDWQRLGAEQFVFETLDTLAPSKDPASNPKEDLKALEVLWRERLAAEGEQFYR